MKPKKLTYQQFPLLRLIVPVLIGAYAGSYSDWSGAYSYIALAGLSILLVVTIKYRKAWIFPFFLMNFLIGFIYIQEKDNCKESLHYLEQEHDLHALGITKIQWDIDKKRWKGIADIIGSKLKAYIWIEDSMNTAQGDTLIVNSAFKQPKAADWEGSFNFKAFLAHKNIHLINYIRTNDILDHRKCRATSLNAHMLAWKDRQKSRISDYLNKETASIALAMLFGDKSAMDDNLKAQFSQLGMAHILAVSGMHVGILVGMLSFLFKVVPTRIKYRSIIHFILVVLAVWTYVALCDFASSATRAALMMTLYLLAKLLKKRNPAINALSAAAFILFMMDPFVIFDLGAQLSFLALSGILLLFDPIQQFFLSRFHWPRSLASGIAISMAAQFAVAPLILYYFGKLPWSFWLFSIPAGIYAAVIFIGAWVLLAAIAIATPIASALAFVINGFDAIFQTIIQQSSNSIFAWQLSLEYFPVSYVILTLLGLACITAMIYSRQRLAAIPMLILLTCVAVGSALHWHKKAKVELVEINHPYHKEQIIYHKGEVYYIGSSQDQYQRRLEEILDVYPTQSITFIQNNTIVKN